MDYPFSTFEIPVEFDDIDAGGVVYHANYFRLCDRARNRWFISYGADFKTLKDRDIALAVRSIKSDFYRPVMMGTARVTLRVTSSTEKSLTILHEIRTPETEGRLANFTAEIVLVACNYSTARSCSLPEQIKKLLGDAKKSTSAETPTL